MSEGITNFKAGFVAIAGPPNVGKSTLLNTICNATLAAVSAKPHTTQQHIKGILTTSDYQIVFIDTPGFIKPTTRLEKLMRFEIIRASKDDADVILLCVEPDLTRLDRYSEFFKLYQSYKKEVIVLITKIDIYSNEAIAQTTNYIRTLFPTSQIIEISAVKGINIDKVIEAVREKLPFSPPYYHDDILSDRWERYFVQELIREAIFELYEDEIPYSVAVVVELFKEDETPIYILAYIYVSKRTHKMIIIGEKGKKIGLLRETSQRKIAKFLNKDVKLELYVKLRENWQDDKGFLERIMGYNK